MKKRKEETSIFKKKGFYAALYSGVGVVLVAAAIVTYYNNNSSVNNVPPKNNNAAISVEQPATENVIKSTHESYTAQITPTPAPVVKDNSTAQQAQTQSASASVSTDNRSNITAATDKQEAKTTTNNVAKQSETKQEQIIYAEPIIDTPPASSDGMLITSAKNSNTVTNTASSVAEGRQEEPTETVFKPFDTSDGMAWPLEGSIVMDYSMNKTIYDVTLEQFRTNDSIYIQAAVGTQVKCSADGLVVDVYSDRDDGNVVVVDHGNGWVSTYSQLQDTLLVEKGDVIAKGQVIGGVSAPTNRSILQGNHLQFALSMDNEPKDPKEILQ